MEENVQNKENKVCLAFSKLEEAVRVYKECYNSEKSEVVSSVYFSLAEALRDYMYYSGKFSVVYQDKIQSAQTELLMGNFSKKEIDIINEELQVYQEALATIDEYNKSETFLNAVEYLTTKTKLIKEDVPGGNE